MTTPSRILRREPGDDSALPADLHPVLRRVFAARGARDASALDHSLTHLLRTDTLLDMERAVALLDTALRLNQKIIFVGDFDADGATSCALGVRALKACGAQQVEFLVPNRFEYGYGLTPPIVELARARGAELLVTVDNGISSLEGVAAAKAAGMQVLVTDHHLPGARLPAADAIVNPNSPGDPFPSKALAGVGVIFYVMLALRAHLRDTGWFQSKGISEPNFADLLDLVALGTVADVVPLDLNNRRLVAQGLARIRGGRCQPGIGALLKVAGRDPKRIHSSDLGFAVGPRLNAAGRLADMSLGIECLLADDPRRCLAIATELDRLNRERRALESEMKTQALDLLAARQWDDQALAAGLCLFDPSWHQGIIGVVAGRIKDLHHRPVIAFAPAGADDIKGSARSVPGVHIRDLLDAIATEHPDLLSRFGGHAMAAGLSIRATNFERFRQVFEHAVATRVDPALLAPLLHTDGELAAEHMTLDLARRLLDAAPWGQAFPEPLFDGEFVIRELRLVGAAHLRLQLVAHGATFAAIAFNAIDAEWAVRGARARIVYRLAVNDYQAVASLQLVVEHGESVA
ncbi:MAG: single-stranded-DNA-specific exonuclease RecJ [Gammaproteobacteria bacterium]|nr:single-stranded-DNA-specific exonuclease RecJ [Gammaproteobacteria bacterium]